MELIVAPGSYAVCRLADLAALAGVPHDRRSPTFLAVTPDEVSLVCPSDTVPPHYLAVEDGWALLRVDGQLDFGLVGIIAELSRALADAGVPIFVQSTYLTDYVLVKQDRLPDATAALTAAGHRVADAR